MKFAKTKFPHLLLFLIGIFLTIACSKEKLTEKRLTKSDGIWNIDQIDYSYVHQNIDEGISMNVGMGTVYDAGEVVFTETTARFDYIIGGESYDVKYRYFISQDGTFTIAEIEMSFFTDLISSILSGNIENAYENFDIDQSIVAFTGEMKDKRKVEISGTETRQFVSVDTLNIDQEVFVATFILSR